MSLYALLLSVLFHLKVNSTCNKNEIFPTGSGRDRGVGKRVISLSFFLALVYATIQV